MKKIFTLISAVLFSATTFAQVYSGPESVEFDYANNRWFVANHSNQTIVIKNCTTCPILPFATGLGSGPHGLEIVNDTLYACSGATLKAYNINTGAQVFNISLGATFLNGITHDNSGNLYVTDYSGNKIYRFNVYTRHQNVFVGAGLSSPNGIIYDQPNNRCVFVQWGGIIKSLNLTDSTTATVITSTLSSVDGIAKDGAGNYYVSSWTGNKITRYNNTFGAPTTVVSTGLNSPADIFYNVNTDTLAVPCSATTGTNSNTVKFYYFGTAIGVNEMATSNFNLFVSPNPVGERAEINYEINAEGKVTIQLFDIKGQLVKTIANENQSKGKHSVQLDKTGLSAGNYVLKLNSNNTEETKKVIVK